VASVFSKAVISFFFCFFFCIYYYYYYLRPASVFSNAVISFSRFKCPATNSWNTLFSSIRIYIICILYIYIRDSSALPQIRGTHFLVVLVYRLYVNYIYIFEIQLPCHKFVVAIPQILNSHYYYYEYE
jgi:hypothetical protein